MNRIMNHINSFPILVTNSKIVIVSGGFDPIHSGHIHYIKAAKKAAGSSILIVGLNSDEWLKRKKGSFFMPFKERAAILKNIVDVDAVVSFNDNDGTAIELIKKCRRIYPSQPLAFCNGGDRTSENIPEMEDQQLKNDSKLLFLFGIGGASKANSSSWILDQYKAPKTERDWGYYRVLHEWGDKIKLKELTVYPGQSLSMQKHSKRSEFWFVAEGEASVYTLNRNNELYKKCKLTKFDNTFILQEEWHQLRNEKEYLPLKLIEIQYGQECIENDIERDDKYK